LSITDNSQASRDKTDGATDCLDIGGVTYIRTGQGSMERLSSTRTVARFVITLVMEISKTIYIIVWH